MADFPPRGSGRSTEPEAAPSATWAHPDQFPPSWTWKPGNLLLGTWGNRFIGYEDDRHVVVIAGSRAGKSRTVLEPNLKTYPGSMLVVDPKGDLARNTAEIRARPRERGGLGQSVYVLDPFGVSGLPSANHNPLEEIGTGNPDNMPADAAQLADALILSNDKDSHWTDAAKDLIRGLVLHLLTTGGKATLRELRRAISDTNALTDSPDGNGQGLLGDMANNPAFDGVVQNVGLSFLGKATGSERELSGILSTIQVQTWPLDDILKITDRSDFRLGDLKTQPMTVYLVLPATRMGTHARWLRTMITLAIQALERTPGNPSALPVWFMLEEFPVLGHMRSIEMAAGFMAGFGVRLITVVQDLPQLKTHYERSWETFLGNAGCVVAFGNSDQTTTDYLSGRLGQCRVSEWKEGDKTSGGVSSGRAAPVETVHTVPLLAPFEIMRLFSRRSSRALILTPENPPVYINRLKGPEDLPR